MPEDTITPNTPNSIDYSKVPSVAGVAVPIDTMVDDPWDTLPLNAQKYEVPNDNWVAVPVPSGVYKVVSRNAGQAVYVAQDDKGTATLRITKDFNIETTGRTAIYLRGQTDLDILVNGVLDTLAQKADKADTYTKVEVEALIENMINDSIGNLTSILTFKGKVPTSNDLASIQNPVQGDTYQAEDTGLFWTYITTPTPQWEPLSGAIVDLSDYYTKGEMDLLLVGKASQTDLEALAEKIDLLLLQKKPFDYIQTNDPAQVTSGQDDPTKAGEIWFNNDTGLIFIRKESQIDNSLFWLNSIDNALLNLDAKFVKLTGDQTISGVKTFTSNVRSAPAPIIDSDLANKKYVDDLVATISGGGGGIIGGGGAVITNYVTTNTKQTITGEKEFAGGLSSKMPTTDNQVATKLYVDNVVQNSMNQIPQNVVTTDTAQTITGAKTFAAGENPRYDTEPAIYANQDLVSKQYVDDKVAGGVSLPNTIAMWDRANNFAVTNTFNGDVILNEGATIKKEPIDDFDVPNKKYVDDLVAGIDLTAYAQMAQVQTWTAQQTFNSEVFLRYGNPTSLESAVNRGWVETYITDSGFAYLERDNTFTGTNHFTISNMETFDLMSDNGKTLLSANNVNMQVDFPILIKNPKTEAEKDQIADNELVTKAQVVFLAGGGGGGGNAFDTTANYTWTGNNVFNGKLESGTAAASIDDLTDKEIPTKKLVVEKIESFRVVSVNGPSGDYPTGTIWIKTSYEQDPNDLSFFTDKPELYISLGNSKWWALHKEGLL